MRASMQRVALEILSKDQSMPPIHRVNSVEPMQTSPHLAVGGPQASFGCPFCPHRSRPVTALAVSERL